MKKIISFVMVLLICLSMIYVPTNVSANSNLAYFPLNYDYWITYNSIGTPELQMQVYNNTEKTIVSFEIVIYPRDSYGRSLSEYGWGYDYTFEGIMQNIYLNYYDMDTYYWTLYGFDNAVTSTTTVKLSSVLFSDGTVWKNTKSSYYEEINVDISNEIAADGSYIIDDTHQIYLVESGCSIYKRDWYIWNDGVGWVWFSDSIDPVCTVWTPSAAVKVVINNNPNLYKIMSFSVKSPPKFNIKFRNTQELRSTTDVYTNGSFTLGFYDTSLNGEYVFDLWDVNDVTSRSWYVWDDSTSSWVLFSTERGPSCHLWREGDHAIKLVYNDDPNLYAIYTFTIYDMTLSVI